MCLGGLAVAVDQREIDLLERRENRLAIAFSPPPFRKREKKGKSAPNVIGVFTL
jgi:hypothetical protein